ncbi:SH3 domain-containing protein [Ectobacillus funiculus]|uniref:SH3 domain-containing protein n=1 Tax=Ectobacillus funiculus TaxID=137993 RepID=A0ABV5WD23_9BACI
MKKLFGMTAAALCSLGFFASSADAATVVTASALNVRQQPTTSAAVVGKVTNGQSLNVTQRLNGWLQIQYNGQTAYVSTAYTKETSSTTPAPTGQSYYVSADVLNLRTGPGTSYGVLGQLRKGTAVTVLASVGNDWMKVSYNGQTAYVFKPYITSAASNETANTTPAPTGQLYYVSADVLNVRTGPGTGYGSLGQLRKGAAVHVLADAGNSWVKVNYNGQTAYVFKPYITPAAPAVAKEFYAEATAYTPWESKTGITATGYNVKANPNMKLIAVDPKVIPLGSKVWVEGYGDAIAGDTGGVIKGNKIDVLMPTTQQALQWGRKTVKVKVYK